MAVQSHTFQAPKGTRDFYPAEMAVRRHIESVWRQISINHGFEEIEGPSFEHLDLYTVKSGEGIVSELFSFRRAGGDTDYALRPEFTPTLARMYAAKANTLPSPTKWFCIPTHYRAERPQRGRLREFVQWNVDMIGDASPRADAEIIAVAVEVLQRLGLRAADITIKISHRDLIAEALHRAGVGEDSIEPVMALLDRRQKVTAEEYQKSAHSFNLDDRLYSESVSEMAQRINSVIAALEKGEACPVDEREVSMPERELIELCRSLADRSILNWCAFDPGVVRGLAYYTGIVFEIEAAGERAIAGGGRYDKLIELFGGPPTPACGFAMGDVVIRLVLEDKGLLQPGEEYLPRPDVFIISNGAEEAERELARLTARLRAEGYHVRHSYRATRNVGKLLGEADRQRARCVIILGDELQRHHIIVKDLASGEQREVSLDDLDETLAHVLE